MVSQSRSRRTPRGESRRFRPVRSLPLRRRFQRSGFIPLAAQIASPLERPRRALEKCLRHPSQKETNAPAATGSIPGRAGPVPSTTCRRGNAAKITGLPESEPKRLRQSPKASLKSPRVPATASITSVTGRKRQSFEPKGISPSPACRACRTVRPLYEVVPWIR